MKVINISTSFHFPNAIVIETECGHRHVRPITWVVKIGDDFKCRECEDIVEESNNEV